MCTGESLLYRLGGGGLWYVACLCLDREGILLFVCVAVTLYTVYNSIVHFHWRRETFVERKIVLVNVMRPVHCFMASCVLNVTFCKYRVCPLLLLRNTSAGCCVVLCTLQQSLPMAASNLPQQGTC